MKNKLNTSKVRLFGIAVLLTTFVFAACDNGTTGKGGKESGGDSGSITISVGSSGGRVAIPGTNMDSNDLYHDITVTDSSKAVYTRTINPRGGSVSFSSLALGLCKIDVSGYLLEGNKKSIKAVGHGEKVIKAGQNGTVSILMSFVGGGNPGTDPDLPKIVSIKSIPGIIVPATGGTPVTEIDTVQYTGTVEWTPDDTSFIEGKVYTATITLEAKTGYTLQGVPAGFFEVAGAATVSNAANSGVVTAIYPPVANPVSVTGVSLNTTTITLAVGGTETLSATVSPTNATNQNVTWTSGNESVATVADGVVTGVGAGTTIITVTTKDGSKIAICNVTVSEILAAPNLSINGASLTWNAVANASSYSVQVDDNAPVDNGNSTSYSLSGLTAKRTYTIKVKAIGNGTYLDSEWSLAIVYTVTFTVTFESNGGSMVASQTVAKGDKATRPGPTRSGYAFLGWYSDTSFNNLFDFGTTVDDDFTLIAQWRETTPEEKVDFGVDATINDIFEISNIAGWEAAIAAIREGGNNKNYTIDVGGDFNVPGSTNANTFGSATGIKVSLRGNRTLTLSGAGNLIRTAASQTVILRELTLKGNNSNNVSLVNVSGANSAFVMQSGEISGNISTGDGGVFIDDGATFTMNNGSIIGIESYLGGGVRVRPGGRFNMNYGVIGGENPVDGNTAQHGGGVYIEGTFTMNDGKIYNNTATTYGGGVFVNSSGIFNMNGGTIGASDRANGNKAMSGGGVYVAANGTFSMDGGTISCNDVTVSSNGNGGGVYVATNGEFIMGRDTQNPTIDDNLPKISGNKAYYGGGVYVNDNATFQITNGIIYGNEQEHSGKANATYEVGTGLSLFGAALFTLLTNNSGCYFIYGYDVGEEFTFMTEGGFDDTIRVEDGELKSWEI